jgi:hypothetical protein
MFLRHGLAVISIGLAAGLAASAGIDCIDVLTVVAWARKRAPSWRLSRRLDKADNDLADEPMSGSMHARDDSAT